nr:sortase [Rhabdothermincola salaria]
MRGGVLVLLFVVFQLWGTAIITDRAQDRLGGDFDELLAETSATTTPPSTTPPTTTDTPTTTTGPATLPADLPVPAPGDPIGRIVIPDIGVDFVYVQGVDLRYLRDGPGHFPQTPMPGQPGNAALAGHRTTYAAPFHRLDELAPGARIEIQTLQGSFTYEVDAHEADGGGEVGHFIVPPSAVWILDQEEGLNRLTLMACHPKYSAAQRIVVTASLVGDTAPPTPLPEPEELEAAGVTVDATTDPLAGGDSSAWPAAIAWSIAAIGVWFATWLVSKWLRRRQGGAWTWQLPPYVVGVPVFAVVCFMAFQDVARLLPAAY